MAATRSDLDPTPGQITVQIIQALTSARVVIAELSGRNPNVYYELGVAHAFGIPVISVVDTTASLPFDMSAERVIALGEGKLSVGEAEKAKVRLHESLKIVLAAGYKAQSLVSEAAQVRSLDALAPENPVAQEISDMRARVEVVVQQTANLPRYNATANYMFELISKLGKRGILNTAVLQQIGMSLDDAPHEGRVDLRETLAAVIPKPPPPPSPPGADDDIPF